MDQRGVEQLVGTPAGPEPAPLSSHVPRQTPGTPVRRSEMGIRTAPPSANHPSRRTPSPAPSPAFTAESLAALTDAQFELQLERAAAVRTRRLSIAIGVATCVVVVVLAVPLSFFVYQAVRAWSRATPPPPVSLDGALAAPDPPVVPEPAAPEPEPEAPAPVPAGGRAQDLVDQGWALVNRDPDGARARFQDALALDPANADANYGVGYALLKQGDPSGAQPWLCTALRTGDLEVRRDVQSLLDSNSLSCR